MRLPQLMNLQITMKALVQLTVVILTEPRLLRPRSLQLYTRLNIDAEGGLYELYWNFDYDAETISFAVRVQTSGWVSFGLSPNGQMPDSNVVIGWVTADGETMFYVSV